MKPVLDVPEYLPFTIGSVGASDDHPPLLAVAVAESPASEEHESRCWSRGEGIHEWLE